MIRRDQAEVREAIAPWAYECVGFEKAGYKGLYLASLEYQQRRDEEGWSSRGIANQITAAGFRLSHMQVHRRLRAIAGCNVTLQPSTEDLESFAARYAGENNALTSSESNEWYTPTEYIESVRAVLGGIDLDPASSDQANQTVGADLYHTLEDDGLQHVWNGRVFMNPPWGDEGPEFGRRLIQQYNAGNTKAAIALFNAHATDTDWFQPYFGHILCFTDHRIDYDSTEEKQTSSTHGSVFAYLGEDWEGFAGEFSRHGAVVVSWKS